jgi:hypothetical protein
MISDVQYRQVVALVASHEEHIRELERRNNVLLGHERANAEHVRTIGLLQNQVAGRNADVVALNKSVEDKDKQIAALQAEKIAAGSESDRLLNVITLYRDDLRALENSKSLVDEEVVRLNNVIRTKDAGIAWLVRAKTVADNALAWCKKKRAELAMRYKLLRYEHSFCLPLFKMTCIVTGRGTIVGAHSYPANMIVTIAAVPEVGWRLAYAGFTLDGRAIRTPFKFVMPAHDVIATALFVGGGGVGGAGGEEEDEEEVDGGICTETDLLLITELGVVLICEGFSEEDEEEDDRCCDCDCCNYNYSDAVLIP